MNLSKINKVIISFIAGIETLTLFPLFFFGIYTLVSSGGIVEKDFITLMGILLIGMGYIASVLLGSYFAIKNVTKPLVAYSILAIPLMMIGIVFLYTR